MHPPEDHVWYVQAGHGRFYVGDTETVAGPGSILWGPRGIPHAFSADSAELRVLVVTMPAGLEAFFLATGEPARATDPRPRLGEPGRRPGGHRRDLRHRAARP